MKPPPAVTIPANPALPFDAIDAAEPTNSPPFVVLSVVSPTTRPPRIEPIPILLILPFL